MCKLLLFEINSAETLLSYGKNLHTKSDFYKYQCLKYGRESNYCNEYVVLTGQEPMRVMNLLKMLAEILGLPQEVKFIAGDYTGHYIRTPYAYQPKIGRKYVPPLHVDLGQVLLELIHEVQKNIQSKKN